MEKYLEYIKKDNFWGRNVFVGKTRKSYVEKIISQADSKNVSALVGVRRSGKSTILKQVLKALIKNQNVAKENTLYLNLEESSIANELSVEFVKNLINEFKNQIAKKGKKYIALDEIQNVENWELLIRNLVDDDNDLKIFITGSSAKLLSGELATKLSGRYLLTEIFPLDFNEYKKFSSNKNIKNYIEFGGFPNAVLEKNKNNKDLLLEDYFNSILLRDIAARYSVRNTKQLRELAIYLYSNNSKLISSLKFSKFLDLSLDTINRYFEYIENAYMGFFIPKFDYSLKKQIYNPKKFYVIDTGIHNTVSFKIIDNLGKSLENIVFLHLRRFYKDIFYWTGKKEVDFLIREGIEITKIINVVFSIKDDQTRQRELAGLVEAMVEFDLPESFLITMNENREIETEAGVVNVVSFDRFVR